MRLDFHELLLILLSIIKWLTVCVCVCATVQMLMNALTTLCITAPPMLSVTTRMVHFAALVRPTTREMALSAKVYIKMIVVHCTSVCLVEVFDSVAHEMLIKLSL